MADIVLYGLPHSNFVRACAMTALEKGASYEAALTGLRDMRSREMQAISPFGKVPVMRHGDLVLFESLAIMRYIDLTFGEPEALQPSDPLDRIRLDQWFNAVMGTVDRHIVREWALEQVFPSGPDRTVDEARIARARKAAARDIAVLERQYAAQGHLVGDRLSLADIVLVCTLDVLTLIDGAGTLLEPAPALARAMTALRQRESWQRACAHSIVPDWSV
ncbi:MULTISPECIES: glutathione S-transferase family protein [Thalassobaculum]|uniref:glutathione transferase n=1 Tax=Thalassobaculum litoreum DSM 18839 TaxID=1123362 RepID=A0A8G2BIU7_9PROT|nr:MULTISPECIES: glutathione S-transferase family protein [Thalassobaculum]SDF95414.1 glutathione S-transferase [Thalassobaculum litoreum DSM 18839]